MEKKQSRRAARAPREIAAILMMLSGAALLAGLWGCPAPPAGGNSNRNANDNSGGNTVDVDIRGFAYEPKEITVHRGQTVRWTNHDLMFHTVTSGNPGDDDAGAIFDSGNLGRGAVFQQTFSNEGEFIYYCRVHPFIQAMVGAKVIVTP